MIWTALQLTARAAGTILLVLTLSFILLRGVFRDPAASLGAPPGLAGRELEELRALTGQTRPIVEQYLDYIAQMGSGDFGHSRVSGGPIFEAISQKLPASLELALAGFLPAAMLAGLLAWLAVQKPNGMTARLGRTLAAMGMALPVFVTGLLMIEIFYRRAGWAPEPSGRIDPYLSPPTGPSGLYLLDATLAGNPEVFASALAQITLPATTMALFAFGPLFRIFFAAMQSAYAGAGVQGARSIGLSEARIATSYAMPEVLSASLPTVSVTFGYMLGANVLVETVFAWPGLGRFALEAMQMQDLASVQGVVLVFALCFVALNLAGELLAAWLDPRLGDAS